MTINYNMLYFIRNKLRTILKHHCALGRNSNPDKTKQTHPAHQMNTPNNRRIGNDTTIDVPATTSTVNRPAFVMKKKYWIPGLLLLLLVLAMVTSHFLTKPKTALAVPQLSASEIQLRKEMEELRKQLAAKPDGAAPLAPSVPPSVVTPPVASSTTTPAALAPKKVTATTHFEHGAIIKRLGKVITRNGQQFRLAYIESDASSKKVLMYPEDRNLEEIVENMSFDGIKPPPGNLTVFDTVHDQSTDQTMNVYAWRLR